jgi:hypothetical protein
MSRKPIAVTALALLVLPGIALANKPTHPVHPGTPTSTTTTTTTTSTTPAHPAGLFVLRGTLSAYAAAVGSTNGSISITVKGSNHESSLLKGTTLKFTVDSKTDVVLHDGKPVANGDLGIVKVRAPKNSTATALQTDSASQVIDQGSSS